jgi:hypothetical protein
MVGDLTSKASHRNTPNSTMTQEATGVQSGTVTGSSLKGFSTLATVQKGAEITLQRDNAQDVAAAFINVPF